MSEVIITATAWVLDEPKVTKTDAQSGEPVNFAWKIFAEASVTDTEGEPVSKVPKAAWKVHLTDALGLTVLLGFTVAEITAAFKPQPGFYLLRLDEFPTHAWVAPTACGIAIRGYVGRKKLKVRGQVVVPIELAGPKVVHMLAPPPGF